MNDERYYQGYHDTRVVAVNDLRGRLYDLLNTFDAYKHDPVMNTLLDEFAANQDSVYHFIDLIYQMSRKIAPHFWNKRLESYVLDNDYLNLSDSNGWNHQHEEYRFKNECMRGMTNNCKSLSNHFNLKLDSNNRKEVADGKKEFKNPIETVDVLSQIFLDPKHGEISSYLFSYALSSLFASFLLNINSKNIPFYVQVAVGKNTAANILIKEIWRICDVNVAIDIRECVCENDTKFVCDDEAYIFSPELDLSQNILLLKHNSDIPVIIDSRVRDDRKYYKSLIKRFAAADFIKVNSMPLFVTDELVADYSNFINIDLENYDIDDEYLELIIKNSSMLSALVYDFIVNCGKNKQNEFKYYGNVYENLPKSLGDFIHNTKSKFYFDIKEKDIFYIFYTTTFFRNLMSSFNNRIASFDDNNEFVEKRLNNGFTFKEHIADFCTQVDKNIFRIHELYSPTRNNARDILSTLNLPYKDEKDIRQTFSKLEKVSNALNIFFEIDKLEKNGDRLLLKITLQHGTKRADIYRKASDLSHRLNKKIIFKPVGNDIWAVISSEKGDVVRLLDLFDAISKDKIAQMEIPLVLGEDELGKPYLTDLAKFPHILIGGSTGQGKSVALTVLATNILYFQCQVKVILIDLVESVFKDFDGCDFLAYPLVTDADTAISILKVLKKEMDNRYEDMKKHGDVVCKEDRIICVIDEFDILFQLSNEAEQLLNNLLARARKANIHLVLATQSANRKKMKSEKGNLNTKMAFKCSTVYQSISIIGDGEAQQLYGEGEMIFVPASGERVRLQGAFIEKKEVKAVTKLHRVENTEYLFTLSDIDEDNQSKNPTPTRRTQEDELIDAVYYAIKAGNCSVKALQDKIHIGNKKAVEIFIRLCDMGIVKDEGRIVGKHGQPIIPNSYEELSDEVKSLLEKTDYSKDEIIELFNRNV